MSFKKDFLYVDNTVFYVDAAASSLTLISVLDVMRDFSINEYANAGRGMCRRASNVDLKIESVREKVAKFIGATGREQIVFNSGATAGLNMAAEFVARDLDSESIVIVSDLDHHSARLPFEELARSGKCKLWVCPLNDNYEMDLECLREKIRGGNVRAVLISAMSNVLGASIDVKRIVDECGDAITVVDAAQRVVHGVMDVSDFGCDILCFSGHKMYADTGVGVMYLKNPERFYPTKFGGGMVAAVAGHDCVLSIGAARFEAGTLPIVQIIGLGTAIDWINSIGFDKLISYEQELYNYLRSELEKLNVRILSPVGASVLTMIPNNGGALDVGARLGVNGVCLRVGTQCASWLHRYMQVDGSLRVSIGPWNSMEEMQRLVEIFKKVL